MDRRKFLKNSCTLCIGAVGIGMLASSCSTTSAVFKTTTNNGKITIPLSQFADKNYLLVRTVAVPYDIFVYKKPSNNFVALLMKCSHRDAAVQYTQNGLVCNEHGSKFDFNGRVVKEPATSPLSNFPVTINNDELIIEIKSN